MNITTGIHQVISVEVKEIQHFENGDFYTRAIVITVADGNEYVIDLFSSDGHKLLVADLDLKEMEVSK